MRCRKTTEVYHFPPRCRGSAESRHIAVIIPGLNNSGDSFNEMTQALCEIGVAPVVVELSEQRYAQTDGAANVWREELVQTIAQAKNQYPEASLSLIGFSLGGVLALDYALDARVPLRQLILISPAVYLTGTARISLMLSDVVPWNWRIPSLAPLGYRRSDQTSLAEYRGVAELRRTVLMRIDETRNQLPFTLIVGRDSDTLVSAYRTRSWVAGVRGPIEYLDIGTPDDKALNDHLLVDRRSFGSAGWRSYIDRLRLLYAFSG